MSEPTDILSEAAMREGAFVGRVWKPGPGGGPTVVLIGADVVHDISHIAATMSDLLEMAELPLILGEAAREAPLCATRQLLASSRRVGALDSASVPCLLAPCDLQVIKACGVTFAATALERVVEERTRGDPALAAEVRRTIRASIGAGCASVAPGSQKAAELKARLVALGMWSQYLEVALGPDAEVFTKASPLSAVGPGSEVGIHRMSSWNNPEPEMVLAVNSRGEAVGATLGNDVNLRDVEGRSALLLGKAKDNNAACAIGPAIRVFDQTFSMDDVRSADVSVSVAGSDGFSIADSSSMSRISRDPLDLVRQAMGPHHQYPDGMMLFLGTMFAPIQDRDTPGLGFTHKIGDIVTISTPDLGALVNTVNYCDAISPWTFGIGELMRNLQRRRLLARE